jgi:hypothetical protein
MSFLTCRIRSGLRAYELRAYGKSPQVRTRKPVARKPVVQRFARATR